MKLVRLAAAELNQTPLDWEGNKARIVYALTRARAKNIGILCLPELAVTGYGCEDTFHAAHVQDTALEVLFEILPDTKGMVAAIGLPVLCDGELYDAAALCVDGELVGFAAKQELAREGIHYEPRWFSPWPAGMCSSVAVNGKDYPFGDICFLVGGVRIGFEICEDAWVEDRPGKRLQERGVQVILNPSASHFAFGKYQTRKNLVLEGSKDFNCAYVYSCLLGNEAGRAIYDGGSLIANKGELVATHGRFSFRDSHLVSSVVHIEEGPDSDAADESEVLSVEFSYPEVIEERPGVLTHMWEESGNIKEEEFARAVSLGLFDYLRKSRANGFVVSLSGGADSATVACMVYLMVRFGLRELGPKGFVERLPDVKSIQGAYSSKNIMRGLLTCVYQGTKNSSVTTREAARAVAEAVGAEFLEVDVEDSVQSYVGKVQGAMSQELNWEEHDLPLQNIQARARGPLVWLIANVKQALLLATSNRSEVAVGYATMDGDTCGGLSPIAGIDKAYLRRWLLWLENTGPDGLGSIPALSAVNAQQPTAELRPGGQTDEADLMPYEVLDRIERFAIRDRLSPTAVLERVRDEMTSYGGEQVANWVAEFYRLWCRNQWKRERYAPSFHLDDASLDPRTWCRFPILSGGYERELKALREYAKENL